MSDDVLDDEDLDHLRGDVLRNCARVLDRECPADGCEHREQHLAEQYPALATSGAWGKYLNPVYRCQGCGEAHTLLVYETGNDADRPKWGEYPPECDDVDGPATAQAVLSERLEAERMEGDR